MKKMAAQYDFCLFSDAFLSSLQIGAKTIGTYVLRKVSFTYLTYWESKHAFPAYVFGIPRTNNSKHRLP